MIQKPRPPHLCLRLIAICSLAALLSSCTTTATSHRANAPIAPSSDGENRLWSASEKFDQALEKSGGIYPAPELENYLNGILEKLFPEYRGAMRAKILRAPILNAMCLPNGSIYINTGLLAVMENEAQLATVLAHEGEHFVQNHSAKQREHSIQAAGWGRVAGILLAGIGVPPDLATLGLMSSITGYSRESESEADNLGHRRLQQAGYDVREAPKVFRQMIREVKAEEIEEPYFFSTHPRLEERIANFEALNPQANDSYSANIQAGHYLEKFSQLRREALTAKLERGQYRALIALLGEEDIRETYGPFGSYLLAESYRLYGREDDVAAAREAFAQAQREGFENAALYRGIGLLEYKNGDKHTAAKAFNKYLELADETDSERGFISTYLNDIKVSP